MGSWMRTLAFALLQLIPAVWWTSAGAQEYPNRAIKLIVTFSPGGFTDVTARLVAQHWTERFGQPVIVENRPGGSTVIGTDAVAKSKPDGYTLLYTGASSFTINYGSFGTGTVSHFAAEYLWAALGGKLMHVPYKGSGPLMAALVAGEVPLSVDTMVVAAPQVRSGKIKAIAVTTATRSSLLPEVPTLAESGHAGFDVGAWVAIAAPAGTPETVLKKLRAEMVRLRDVKEIREKFSALGVEIVGSSPEEFTAKVREETRVYARIAKEANIQAE